MEELKKRGEESGQWGFRGWVSTSSAGWGASDGHFQCWVGGFRWAKKGKLFGFSSARGSNTGKKSVFQCEGSYEQEELFRREQIGGGGVPAGSRAGFARVAGGLLARLFRRGDKEGSNGVAGRVLTEKKSFSSGVALQVGWGSRRRGTTTMEENKK